MDIERTRRALGEDEDRLGNTGRWGRCHSTHRNATRRHRTTRKPFPRPVRRIRRRWPPRWSESGGNRFIHTHASACQADGRPPAPAAKVTVQGGATAATQSGRSVASRAGLAVGKLRADTGIDRVSPENMHRHCLESQVRSGVIEQSSVESRDPEDVPLRSGYSAPCSTAKLSIWTPEALRPTTTSARPSTHAAPDTATRGTHISLKIERLETWQK